MNALSTNLIAISGGSQKHISLHVGEQHNGSSDLLSSDRPSKSFRSIEEQSLVYTHVGGSISLYGGGNAKGNVDCFVDYYIAGEIGVVF